MLPQKFAKVSDTWLGRIAILATVISVAIGGALKIPDDKINQWPLIYSLVEFFKKWPWLTLPLSTVIATGCEKLRPLIGDERKWNVVQILLDHYREEIFGKDTETKKDPLWNHRVTMFKHCAFKIGFVKWPWSGWMVAVSRSNHATKSRIRCFKASLNKPGCSEGIAGRVYTSSQQLSVEGLPNLGVSRASPDDWRQYAERSFLPRERLTTENSTARSLLGIPIEVNGKPWGCLVLDSQNPKAIKPKKDVYTALAKTFNELLR